MFLDNPPAVGVESSFDPGPQSRAVLAYFIRHLFELDFAELTFCANLSFLMSETDSDAVIDVGGGPNVSESSETEGESLPVAPPIEIDGDGSVDDDDGDSDEIVGVGRPGRGGRAKPPPAKRGPY